MLQTVLIIVLIVIAFLLLTGGIVLLVRWLRFRPTRNKQVQLEELNQVLEPTGFAYELRGDYFYSLQNCWQREMGYCSLYDEGAPFFNMIMDCEPITFRYGGRRWLIELWKGQYGITTGAEMGVYNTTREDIRSQKFNGPFYEAVCNREMLPMSFVLRKNGKVLLRRQDITWWLTGFRLGEFTNPDALAMDARITFPNYEMLRAFIGGLQALGYNRQEYSIRRRTVLIHYTTPHSRQPVTRNQAQETMVQRVNADNVRLYQAATARFTDTLDKLELLRTTTPELFQIMLKSLYARGLFDAFEWIRDMIGGDRSEPIAPPLPPLPPDPPDPPCPPWPPDPPCPPWPPDPPCPPCPPDPPDPPCPSYFSCPSGIERVTDLNDLETPVNCLYPNYVSGIPSEPLETPFEPELPVMKEEQENTEVYQKNYQDRRHR